MHLHGYSVAVEYLLPAWPNPTQIAWRYCTCRSGTEGRCLIALNSPFFGNPLLIFIAN